MTKCKQFNMKSQRGMTLFEVMIVIGILAVIVAGVLKLQQNADNSAQRNSFVEDISLIVTQARAWKAGAVNYNGLDMEELTDSELLYADWADGTSVNPAGGNYAVGPDTSDPRRLRVTATGLPNSLCLAVERQVEASTDGGNQATCSNGTLTLVYL